MSAPAGTGPLVEVVELLVAASDSSRMADHLLNVALERLVGRGPDLAELRADAARLARVLERLGQQAGPAR